MTEVVPVYSNMEADYLDIGTVGAPRVAPVRFFTELHEQLRPLTAERRWAEGGAATTVTVGYQTSFAFVLDEFKYDPVGEFIRTVAEEQQLGVVRTFYRVRRHQPVEGRPGCFYCRKYRVGFAIEDIVRAGGSIKRITGRLDAVGPVETGAFDDDTLRFEAAPDGDPEPGSVAGNSFTLTYDNGTEQLVFAQDSDFWLTELPDISSVQVAISEVQTTGQVGAVMTAQRVLPKTLLLKGSILADAEWNRETLLRVVAPGVTARLTYTRNSKSWYMEGTPARTPKVSGGTVTQDFTVEFRAPCPYWKSVDEGPFILMGVVPRFSFPFSTAAKFVLGERVTAYTGVFVNSGNVPTDFELQVKTERVIACPTLTHLGTGQRIRVDVTVQPGQTLVVSTVYGRRGVWLEAADGSRENVFRHLSLDSDLAMCLAPGENQLHFNADYNRESAEVVLIAPKGVRSGV